MGHLEGIKVQLSHAITHKHNTQKVHGNVCYGKRCMDFQKCLCLNEALFIAFSRHTHTNLFLNM